MSVTLLSACVLTDVFFAPQRGGKGTRGAGSSRQKPAKPEPEVVTISDSDEDGSAGMGGAVGNMGLFVVSCAV